MEKRFVLLAVILGIVLFFLIASGIEQWAWFIALLPIAVLLFAVYFAIFAAFGKVVFLIASFVALFVMIWLVYFSFINQAWSLLAFPIIFLVMALVMGFGWGAWNRRSVSNLSNPLSEVDLSVG